MDNVENEVTSKLTLLDSTCLKLVAAIFEIEMPEERRSNAKYLLKRNSTVGNAGLLLFLKVNDFLKSTSSPQNQLLK